MNRRFVGVKAVSVTVAGLLLGLLLVVEKPIRSTFHSEAPRLLVSALCLAAACVLFLVLLRYVTEWIALGRLPVAERRPNVVPQERTTAVVYIELQEAVRQFVDAAGLENVGEMEEFSGQIESLTQEWLGLLKERQRHQRRRPTPATAA